MEHSKNFTVEQFKNSTHKILILSRIEKNGMSCAFLRDAAGFLKITLSRP